MYISIYMYIYIYIHIGPPLYVAARKTEPPVSAGGLQRWG